VSSRDVRMVCPQPYIHPDITYLELKIISLKFIFDPVPALVRQALLQTKLERVILIPAGTCLLSCDFCLALS
jgi:hypothetical protein